MFNQAITFKQRFILDLMSIPFLLITLSIGIVLIGCGWAPAGLIVALGLFAPWPMPAIGCCWIGVVLLVISMLFIRGPGHLLLNIAALAMFVISWTGIFVIIVEGYDNI